MGKRMRMRRVPTARVKLSEQEFNELLQKPYLTAEEVQPLLVDCDPDFDAELEWQIHEDLAKGAISDELFDMIAEIEN